ncbi:MAG: homocysteine S-methyltransferase family protein [Lachnospiraceae bacterium]|nr:homocysteine S-methyltransferase family protein [Lachnospiraceae bacterium]
MEIRELLKSDYIILDGAMGTMLQGKGMEMGTIPETLNITKPEWIVDIHSSYIAAGSMVVYANTFGANRYKMADSGYSVKELIGAAIANAKKACEGTDCKVALDLGPIGQLLEPTGSLTFDEAYDMFKEEILAAEGADLIVIETMTDLLETKAAVLAAKENSDLPVFCTMTFERNMRTFTGCSVPSMVLTIGGLGVDAIGVNCSLGPDELIDVVAKITEWTDIPVMVKPNAGLPDPVTNLYDVSPEEFAQSMRKMAELGVHVFGGCCGTNPDYIREVAKMLDEARRDGLFEERKVEVPLAVCSSTNTVVVDRPQIIGERINPTGKKRFKEALINNDIDYILSQAIEQIDGGANILDVNVGLPEIDERDMMIRTIKALQGIVDTPLQIDSTKPEVLEAALRVYNGKPIVNSVNGEEEVLDRILPLVKKYGAAVIGLALDENGIPDSAEGRVEIAKRILDKALSYGIRKENVIIDCLTLTVSAEQKAAKETLKAMSIIRDELGLKNVLGVSNISFGLPNRELVNKTFLTMALTMGLDLPIINPNVSSMVWAVRTYNVLADIDKNAMEFIEESSKVEIQKEVVKSESKSVSAPLNKDIKSLEKLDDRGLSILRAMETGMKNDGSRLTKEYLEDTDAMVIINDMLIPALDVVGEKFEKNIIFLPQLILAADVAKVCFEEIKTYMANKGGDTESKGKIILATVKGDIHDIGKNIVKVILENYGYDVIDLGRDVDCQLVVDEAIKHNVKLVGLSALMTTTLCSMEETIRLLRENNVDCKVMVGGAVLTPDYAMSIGADYYAKDAKESADIAKIVLG